MDNRDIYSYIYIYLIGYIYIKNIKFSTLVVMSLIKVFSKHITHIFIYEMCDMQSELNVYECFIIYYVYY